MTSRRRSDMKKILIIEDEPNIRELILYNLKTNGYDGIAAEDGVMGITMVQRERPDLILLDIMLPGKTGYDADDYISKPFGIRELMARIKAVLRRYEVTSSSGHDTIISVGDLSMNVECHEVKVGDRIVDLTLREFELLKYLVENRGHVFTRDQLLNNVWGIDYAGETRTVDVHIRHLRQKLSDGDNEEKYIETIRGKGYKVR